ncbi:hydroxymethylpyrimidine/phosphomethylpyrimidine kinase [Pseudomonadota bacterium]
MSKNIPSILIIAGSDSVGASGLQADIKSTTSNGVYASSALTSVVAENTLGVQKFFPLEYGIIKQQIDSVLSDIRVDVIKTGIIFGVDGVNAVYDGIKDYLNKIPLVFDPVIVSSTTGEPLFDNSVLTLMKEKLLVNCFITAPNKEEAELLCDCKISNIDDAINACRKLCELGAKNAVVKSITVDDKKICNVLVTSENQVFIFKKKLLNIGLINGGGCTFASTLASFLAKKLSVEKSVKRATDYTWDTINNSFKLGAGFNVLKHF